MTDTGAGLVPSRRPPAASLGGVAPRSSGFTFVEVLVAVTVLAVGLLALTSFAMVTGREFSKSKQTMFASSLAREQIDSLRAVPYKDLTVGNHTFEATGGGAELSVTRVITEPRPHLKLVVVSVVGSHGKEYQRFSTFVYDEDPAKNVQQRWKK